MTVGGYIGTWLADPPSALSPLSLRSYRKVLVREVLPTPVGRTSLDALGERHVAELIESLSARGLSHRSVGNVVDALGVVLKSAHAAGLVARVGTDHRPRPAPLRRRPRR